MNKYSEPEMEIIKLLKGDIITFSRDPDELPDDEWGNPDELPDDEW